MSKTQYFKSFAGYGTPLTPVDPVTFDRTQNLPTYYVSIIADNGDLLQLKKVAILKRENRQFSLLKQLKAGESVYFPVKDKEDHLIDWKPFAYANTETLSEYYCGIVDTSGLGGDAVRFERVTAFEEEYLPKPTSLSGIANVSATFNNTAVSITDTHGHVLGWSSAGRVGFKGLRKRTAYAARQVAQDAARQAMSKGIREVEIRIQGPGSGREAAIRALQAVGLEIRSIKDVTPIPHEGPRRTKKSKT